VPKNKGKKLRDDEARDLLSSAIKTYEEAHPAPRGKAADGVLKRLDKLWDAVKSETSNIDPDEMMKVRAFADITNALDLGDSLIGLMVAADYKVEDTSVAAKVLDDAKAALPAVKAFVAHEPERYQQMLSGIEGWLNLKATPPPYPQRPRWWGQGGDRCYPGKTPAPRTRPDRHPRLSRAEEDDRL
jgi:hypothetical protein